MNLELVNLCETGLLGSYTLSTSGQRIAKLLTQPNSPWPSSRGLPQPRWHRAVRHTAHLDLLFLPLNGPQPLRPPSVLIEREGQGAVRAIECICSLTKIDTLDRTKQPSLGMRDSEVGHHPSDYLSADKTTLRGSDYRYGTALPKLAPTRRAYGCTHYGTGLTTLGSVPRDRPN